MQRIIQKLQKLFTELQKPPALPAFANRMMCDALNENDEVHVTTPELITKHGYVAETHHVWTEDGYRLELHRITGKAPSVSTIPAINAKREVTLTPLENESKSRLNTALPPTESVSPTSSRTAKLPVLINHGLLSSSADWVLLGPNKALAYLLTDAGYDVWLANARGNTYSQCHKCWTIKDKEFWNFSVHEVGFYDLPAMIDYILEKTGHEKLHYVAYSQGTTSFFVMASEKPEYNNKVISMIGLAPIAFLSNHGSPLLKVVVPFNILMEWGSSYCNIHQWFPRNKLQARALSTILRNTPDTLTKTFCYCWFYLVAGFGSNQLDKSMLPLIFGHFPSGASVQQIRHFAQNIQSDSFRKFDYGPSMNLKIYGTTQPPKYKLENVTVPVCIFYSDNDFLTQPADVKRLVDSLPNVKLLHKIEYSKFNHIDYLWGKDSKTLLYNHVLKALEAF